MRTSIADYRKRRFSRIFLESTVLSSALGGQVLLRVYVVGARSARAAGRTRAATAASAQSALSLPSALARAVDIDRKLLLEDAIATVRNLVCK